ncbi:unnamed protein product, partial [Prorocentrum cordatum]
MAERRAGGRAAPGPWLAAQGASQVSLKAKQPADAPCTNSIRAAGRLEPPRERAQEPSARTPPLCWAAEVDHILFRREHGPLAPVPARPNASPPPIDGIRWVVCDLIDMLLSWHARNGAVCDIFSVLLQLGPEGQEAQ